MSSSSSQEMNLPLGWTRVRRRRKIQKTDVDMNLDETMFRSSTQVQSTTKESMITWTGEALFCLHEVDCTWFQGYFLPQDASSHATSFALLATNRADMDDCLACDDCGYRYLDITLYIPLDKKQQHLRRQILFERVQGWGGDMMSLQSPMMDHQPTLQFHPDLFYTNDAAQPFLEKFFAPLFAQLSPIPNCVIIKGKMTVTVFASTLNTL